MPIENHAGNFKWNKEPICVNCHEAGCGEFQCPDCDEVVDYTLHQKGKAECCKYCVDCEEHKKPGEGWTYDKDGDHCAECVAEASSSDSDSSSESSSDSDSDSDEGAEKCATCDCVVRIDDYRHWCETAEEWYCTTCAPKIKCCASDECEYCVQWRDEKSDDDE